MVQTMKQIVGFKDKLTFDTVKSDDTPRKLIDIKKIKD